MRGSNASLFDHQHITSPADIEIVLIGRGEVLDMVENRLSGATR